MGNSSGAARGGAFLLMSGMIFACQAGYTEPEGAAQEAQAAGSGPAVPPSLPAAATLPAQADEVRLTISSAPLEVEIFADGVFAGLSPVVLRYPRSKRRLALQFHKEGYLDATQEVSLERDVPVIAKLRPAKKRGATSSRTE